MVTPDEAAQLGSVSTRTIYRRIETGRLHFTETDKGFSLICLQSLESNANWTPAWREEAAASAAPGSFRKRLIGRMLKRR